MGNLAAVTISSKYYLPKIEVSKPLQKIGQVNKSYRFNFKGLSTRQCPEVKNDVPKLAVTNQVDNQPTSLQHNGMTFNEHCSCVFNKQCLYMKDHLPLV